MSAARSEQVRGARRKNDTVRRIARNVRFAKVDIEQNPRIVAAYRISSIPAVLLFEAGEPSA